MKPSRWVFYWLSLLIVSPVVLSQTDPAITSWRINQNGATGSSTNAAIHAIVSQYPADVQRVRYNSTDVYIDASGVPSYSIGPWTASPNVATDRHWLLRIPRSPTVQSGTKTSTLLGTIGVFINGVPIYNAKDAISFNNQGIWNQNAVTVEGGLVSPFINAFDSALGHPSEVSGGTTINGYNEGEYHHHQRPVSLLGQIGDSSATHSKIVGFAFDGFPVYGPYGYANTDGTGGVVRITSSYRLKSGNRPPPSGSSPGGAYNGKYIEDYEYVSGLGHLDQYNGRTSVTPEYPGGIYHYHATIDSSGNSAFPYIIGTQYYGVVGNDNLTHTVTVPENTVDYGAPVAICKDITIALNAEGSASIVAEEVNNGSSVTYGAPALSVNPSSFTCANKGINPVTLTVTDFYNNTATCSATVTVLDNATPTIACPDGVTVGTNDGCTATGVALGNPITSDNCAVASVTNNAPTIFPLGNTSVIWTVTDTAGLTATCTQSVTVIDIDPPTIACPDSVTVGTNDGCTATGVALGNPITSDNCAVASVTNNAPTIFPLGNTSVIWTVTDTAGLTATCTQSVTVIDIDPPTITCPDGVTVGTNDGCTATDVSLGNPITSDNCAVASVTNNAPTIFPLGNTSVIWTVTDTAGLTATCTQSVTVNDTDPPTIMCSPDIGPLTQAMGENGVVVTWAAPIVSDHCPGMVLAQTSGPASGSLFSVGTTTIGYTATDAAGNMAECDFSVTVTAAAVPVTHKLHFDRDTYEVSQGQSLEVMVIWDGDIEQNGDQGAANGLFSYGVKITVAGSTVQLPVITSIAPAGELDYNGFDVGALTTAGGAMAGLKGTIALNAFEPYFGVLIGTMNIDTAGAAPGAYQLEMTLYRTLGPGEEIFIDFNGTVLDDSIVFESSTLIVQNQAEPVTVPTLNEWGMIALILMLGLMAYGKTHVRHTKNRFQ